MFSHHHCESQVRGGMEPQAPIGLVSLRSCNVESESGRKIVQEFQSEAFASFGVHSGSIGVKLLG